MESASWKYLCSIIWLDLQRNLQISRSHQRGSSTLRWRRKRSLECHILINDKTNGFVQPPPPAKKQPRDQTKVQRYNSLRFLILPRDIHFCNHRYIGEARLEISVKNLWQESRLRSDTLRLGRLRFSIRKPNTTVKRPCCFVLFWVAWKWSNLWIFYIDTKQLCPHSFGY